MAETDYQIDDTVDITPLVCPMTFVTAKAALEEHEIGQVLRVHLNAGEPMQNVPRSFRDDGQQVLALKPSEDGDDTYDLDVRKLEEA